MSRGCILVVDDALTNRMLLTRMLQALGHEVTTASNGREALESMRDREPDIVLLDVLMPELNGFEALEQMKADPKLRAVPVIMISALDDLDGVIRCIELGAEDYLHKPFDPVLLRARISAGLDKRRLQQLERDRVRGLFARFLPEPMVEEVLSRADGEFRLGGVRVVSTVLFADLRAFTTFSERTAPDEVIEVLNRYFSEMVDAVLDNSGTLIAFRGDGLTAMFGAPIELADHADRAVAAAREMISYRLPRFNDWAREQGYEPFRIGIGMCSGSVMSGNVGSERRLEYTAVGDAANTACRIEGLTKELGHPVLLSGSTYELMTVPVPDLEYVDEVTVRGRAAPTRIWALRVPSITAVALEQSEEI